jgi:hypothetical protein
MAQKARGECLCGMVKFEIDLPVKWVAHCHCSMCRRAHGAAFVTWVSVPTENFRLLTGEDELVEFDSSEDAQRGFCMVCGSTLFFDSSRWPEEKHIVLANFTDDVGQKPQVHAFFSDKAHWIDVNDGLPRKGGKTGLEPL